VKIKYEIINTKTTPFGGLYVFSEFLKQIDFHNLFNNAFGRLRKIRQYSPSQNLILMMSMIIEGGERLYDIEQFSKDQTICTLFNLPSIPNDTTLRDDLMLIGQRSMERAELLIKLNEMLFDKFNITSITVDIDGTALPVDGHQEGANKGYCPTEIGKRCFQSLKAICDDTETVIAEKTMTGECHCSHGIIEFMKSWLDRFSPKMETIKLRFDTGFYSADLMTFLESYPNVIYEIGVSQHQWLQAKIRQLQYRSYYNSERQYCSFAYGEGREGSFRYYYVERSEKENDQQLELFDSDLYKYRIVVSNRYKQPQSLFDSYNKRGRVEKHIEELKNEYALGKMVSGSFIVTKALCWLSHLAFTLISMLRHIAFRREMKKYRLRRLRYLLFIRIGYFVKRSRKRYFKIDLGRIGPLRFHALMQRIWAF
jgi:hypothetical protein